MDIGVHVDNIVKHELIRRPWVLGLCGYARVGKDTAADILVKHFEHIRIKKIALAALLTKDLEGLIVKLKELFPGFDVNKPEDKELFRRMWVEWGKTLRNKDSLILCKRLAPSINALIKQGNNVIITDIRYLHEIEYFETNYKAKIVYIDRKGFGAANDEESKSFGEIYVKRNELMQVGLHNNGTLDDYELKVIGKIAEVLKLELTRYTCDICNNSYLRPLINCDNCGKGLCRACLKVTLKPKFTKLCPECFIVRKKDSNENNK